MHAELIEESRDELHRDRGKLAKRCARLVRRHPIKQSEEEAKIVGGVVHRGNRGIERVVLWNSIDLDYIAREPKANSRI